MVAFVTALVLLAIGIGIVVQVAKRRPPGTPLTWAEAILAATFTLGLMLVAYGVVPDRWLALEQNEWKWRADAIAYVVQFWGRGRIVITKQAIGDIVVAGIYGAMLGINFVLWSWWQKRGQRQAQPAPELGTSVFGRPVVRRA